MLKELWQLEEVAEILFVPFVFSYNELPLAVKHCFSYCGLFPSYDIYVDELIRLWMMQGYLISSNGIDDDDMELKGMGYFEKLAARSFFLNVTKNDSKQCYIKCDMHKMVHSFAQYLIKTAGGKVEEIRNFSTNNEQLPPNQLGRLKSVRVLNLSGIQELPLGIGNLLHLRYLSVIRTRNINKLPATICNLYNLQTLDLRFCLYLSELPKQIHKLRNVRHLLLHRTPSLKRIPQGVGKLTALRIFDEFKVGRKMSKLIYLAELNQLRGSMHIYMGDLNEEEDVEDAEKAQLRNKIYIGGLSLEINGEVRMDVMEALQVPPNLQYLLLTGYKATQFPSWFNYSSLSNLRSLVLKNCSNCLHLPPLGILPVLEVLSITGMDSLQCLGIEFLWAAEASIGLDLPPSSSPVVVFEKLRKLEFRGCGSWEVWEDSTEYDIMPCLQTLEIIKCKKLKAMPRFLRRDPKISIKAPHHLLQQLYQDMEAQN